MKRWIPPLGWGLCAFALAAMAAGAVLQEVQRSGYGGSWVERLGLLVAFAAFPVIGAAVAARQPRNPLGWIFIAIGLCIGVILLASEYAHLALVKRPGQLPLGTLAAWLEAWLWYPAVGLIAPITLLLFPDGKPPSRRWRPVLWVSAATLGAIVIAATFQDRFVADGYSIDNPIGLGFAHVEQALGGVFALFGVCAVLGAVSLVVRFWRSQGDERQQLKLLTLAACVVVTLSALGDIFELPEVLFPLVLWMIPAAVAVAIFRYRLYDIDIVINRTLVYGLLTAILAAVYLGVVVALQGVLGSLTADSDLAVAGSTLTVAALFGPLRSRVQGFIDRRFNRRRYDAQRTLESFSSRLREEVDLDHLAGDLAAVVRETMQPAHVSVWLRGPQAEVWQP